MKLNRYCLASVMFCLGATISITTAHAQTLVPDQSQACQTASLASLDAAIAGTLAAFRSGNAKALLSQFDPRGVQFGSDGQFVSLKALKEDFSRHTGLYCALFTCEGKAGRLGLKGSATRIDRQIDLKHGLGSAFINANSQEELELSYRLTPQCRWVLNGVSVP